ncbi:pentapeptide repeat-containing protein [Lentzea sp. NPDC051838]|uniref:pentapeptide repeat-containing protein n=1 Tax=Lentzea sp. NPDC051838 TaxID=3154849 RepID=UPI003415F740
MTSSRVPLEPMPRKVIAWVAAGIALFTIGLVVLLWWWGTAGLSGKELVTARLDALRTGLSIGIGGGGVFALYLAWRRQHATEMGLVQKERDQADVERAFELQREVAASTERDAAARRVTDLYTKASEQLGSEKAPVRLAGIYALERLAQDNAEQRQTIVNLLCAYLRMPYQPPGDEPDGEREVRRTAQQVLSSHLRPADEARYWPEVLTLHLAGAVLVDADFQRCRFGDVDFSKAVFAGAANFEGAVFAGLAAFGCVEFERAAYFNGSEFATTVVFTDATFHGVEFNDGRFGTAQFRRAKFRQGDSGYDHPGDFFTHADFKSAANFQQAKFDTGVDFTAVTGVRPSLGGAHFGGRTLFDRTSAATLRLAGGPDFSARVSTGDVADSSTWPDNWVIGEDGVITERPAET